MYLKEKIKFVLYFVVYYFVLLVFGLYVVGPFLMDLQYRLLDLIFKDISTQLVFVAHCSGIISIVTYLSVVLALLTINKRVIFKKIVTSVLLLLLYNLFRLSVIVWVAKKSIEQANTTHVVSWFLVFGLLILLILKDFKKIKI